MEVRETYYPRYLKWQMANVSLHMGTCHVKQVWGHYKIVVMEDFLKEVGKY